jgi:hypothetical protein
MGTQQHGSPRTQRRHGTAEAVEITEESRATADLHVLPLEGERNRGQTRRCDGGQVNSMKLQEIIPVIGLDALAYRRRSMRPAR